MTNVEMSGRPVAGRFGMTAFRLGAFVGFAGPIVLVAALNAMPPKFTADVVSSGAVVSAHQAAKIVVADEGGAWVEQTCNAACDDLRVQARTGDNSVFVRILDRAGRCLLCSIGVYVTSGSTARLSVGGDKQLELISDYRMGY